MHKLVVLGTVLAVMVAVAVARPEGADQPAVDHHGADHHGTDHPAADTKAEDKYDTKFDDFDVDTFIKDEARLKEFGKCLLDKAPCNDVAAYLKSVFPDVLATECKKCNKKQRINIRKVFLAVKDKDLETFEAIGKHYDPDNKYEKQVDKFLAETD